MSALHTLLNTPCSTCAALPDSRVWLSHLIAGVWYSECPDCYEAREGVADIGDYTPHVTLYPTSEPEKLVRIKANRRKKPMVSNQQMELF
jgi:hypothetical protein